MVRIDHIGDATAADSAWMWVNPLLSSEPSIAAADAKLTVDDANSIDFTFGQIRLFVGNTSAGNPFAQMNFDELRLGTTFADVAPIAAAGGNANFDGINGVDGHDFLIWQRNIGTAGGQPLGNADSTGNIDGTDLGIIKSHFGQATAASVPEPAGAILGALALMGLSFSRRKVASHD